MNIKTTLAAAALLLCPAALFPSNPYLPVWEHIPDGEPYLFDDPDAPGKKRVYIYGSHDIIRTHYCGKNLVVWSAPADSLNTWRYDGVIFESKTDGAGRNLHPDGSGDLLYAPDVAERRLPDGRREYYLYPNNQNGGRNGMVAVSSRPDGPFRVINWSKDNPAQAEGVLGFDPAVLIDDDGRVYGYWGFETSYGAELDPATMATVKEGTTIVKDLIPGHRQEGDGRFYEASSIRKIKDKYVLVYSRITADGEFGLPASNYTLAYAYSDNPLGPFKYGGTIIDARGRDTDADGNSIVTATPNGNTHGGIVEINGRWWVFYHRQSGADEFARQAMAAPIDVEVTAGQGGAVRISEAEYTSEGFETAGLDPLRKYPAAIACHFTGPTAAVQEYPRVNYSGPYFQPVYTDTIPSGDPYAVRENMNPVVNNTAGSVLGYKYFNFDKLNGKNGIKLSLDMIPGETGGTISVYTSAPWKGNPKPEGTLRLAADMPSKKTTVTIPLENIGRLSGKHPLYLTFDSPVPSESLCTILYLQFKD